MDVDRHGNVHFANANFSAARQSHVDAHIRENRNPVDLNIPVHPDLRETIDATPSAHLTFLTTVYGRAFTPAGFGNKFREWCNEAGLPHCSAH